MGHSYGDGYQTRIRFGGGALTPGIRALLIANGALFAVQVALHIATKDGSALTAFENWVALKPALAIGRLRLWQFITHAFLHDIANPLHIMVNMFMLWMFGGEVESRLGRTRFFKLYFAAAVAGGICMIPWFNVLIVGASGAVFGVMATYGRLFPYRRVLVFGLIPVRARTLVLVLVGLDLFFAMQGSRTGTAHLAHVGGFAIGWFFLPLEAALDRSRRTRELRRDIRREESDAETRKKVDDLLAKVGRDGLGSLTRSEREFLNRASRTLRR